MVKIPLHGVKNKKTIGKTNGIVGALMTCDGKFLNPDSGYSVVFDDDGRVAYAYLLNESEAIVSDVWLYNCCASPSEPEWKDPEKMPFANPVGFVKANEDFSPVKDISEIRVQWGSSEGAVKANVFIHDELFAILVDGEKPGWSILATKNGPLAKVLER
ncbi:hypothetical protein J4E05_16685 [Thalassospira sp. NFXS8]|uniref:hypothetical protein n=1 Tax=Thalassospira sp. NFXS8 TaxID=2819093 RepID=UPI0032DF70B3